MWVEELRVGACPLGGFTAVCNKCEQCHTGVHHAGLLGKVWPYVSQNVCSILVYKDELVRLSKSVAASKHFK